MSAGAASGGLPVAHHFESAEQQLQSARLGMWIFLATEVLFFGGLLCAYSVYRSNHPEIFIWAHTFLDKNLGALNTVILICSSFTMAWAVRAAQLRQTRLLVLMLVLTLLASCGFLGVKFVEYSHKWQHGLLWASRYAPDSHVHDAAVEEPVPAAAAAAMAPAARGPAGLAAEPPPVHAEHPAEPRNARVFFSIYFMLTGLHGLHVIGGMMAMLWLLWRALRGDFAGGYFTPVDMTGLYWHLVDLIWIYLFLLLYLIH